ncbi:co-chaperone GroES [Atopobacter phocae]|uniref:co-chaperone GroES n=1 Tax=Atopobacter phocae TaxID=136492 RepID=UPI0004B289F8|nr:co-chaperone GroES [Atopobacter phocae]
MLKPLNKRVILKEIEEKTTESGFVLPTSAQEKSNMAEVIAISSAIEEPTFKTGDKVIYDSYLTTKVNYAGQDYLVIKAEDIMAIVE